MAKHVDILIIGGGLTGAALMLALADSGYETLLVDKEPVDEKIQPDFDARSLALATASKRILEMLGIWAHLNEYVCPIERIHVSEQYRFGHTRLDKNKTPLGYVVEMQHLHHAFSKKLTQKQLLAPATLLSLTPKTATATIEYQGQSIDITANLIVAADGADSKMRAFCELPKDEKIYNQHALVANIGLKRPHRQQAFERFTASGPLALLPMTETRCSMVWSLSPEKAKVLQNLPETEFLKHLQQAFGYRLGRFVKAGQRAVYPLRQVIMPVQHAWPVIFIGNAAHTLHPVAGQGFNLGLRDVAMLAQSIIAHGLEESMLNHYQKARALDQNVITRFTNGLITLFSLQTQPLGMARGLGLFFLDNLLPAQRLLAEVASGYAGTAPDLACNIPLVIRKRIVEERS